MGEVAGTCHSASPAGVVQVCVFSSAEILGRL